VLDEDISAILDGDDGIQRLMLVSLTLYGGGGDHNRCWISVSILVVLVHSQLFGDDHNG
jgi:hypothetical protein